MTVPGDLLLLLGRHPRLGLHDFSINVHHIEIWQAQRCVHLLLRKRKRRRVIVESEASIGAVKVI